MKLLNATMTTIMTITSAIRSVTSFVPSVVAIGKTPSSSSSTLQRHSLFNQLFSTSATSNSKYPIMADESIMSKKKHGTSDAPVQKNLRWNCDYDTADRICNFNRHYAEYAGYWTTTDFIKYVQEQRKVNNNMDVPIKFYDSVTGKLLFTAPVGRTMDEFIIESKKHGWPSFRDEETNWEYVRVLKDGECVSTTGTHLGHNLPDKSGNRYCINLVSVAGQPMEE